MQLIQHRLALVVLALAGSTAHAQSSVSINGFIDGSVVYERGGVAGSAKKVSSGVSGPTRLIFRGSEDLGGGLSAIFHLEHGLLVDTGGSLQPNFWGRQSYLGLIGGAGSLRLGLMYTPLFTTFRDIGDPFRASFTGNGGNIFTAGVPAGPNSIGFPNPSAITGTVASAGPSRANTAFYTSPTVSGFSGEAAYSFGEQVISNSALRTIGASIGYSGGPLNVRLAYSNTKDATAANTAKNALLGANYDFGLAKLYLAYGNNKGYGTAKSDDYLVGVNIPVGLGLIMASYARKNDTSPANNDVSQIGIGYAYYLSKRTYLHASAARIHNTLPNTSPGFYTVAAGPSGAGTGNKAIAAGIGHYF